MGGWGGRAWGVGGACGLLGWVGLVVGGARWGGVVAVVPVVAVVSVVTARAGQLMNYSNL